jgi:histidine triad (HIT) family protein
MATLFTKIINGEIPGKIIFQDDVCVALVDIQPQAPQHVLVIPKKEIQSLAHATPADEKILGHLMMAAAKVAKQLGVSESGYRLVINTGKHGGQTVDHLHIHLLGGRPLEWPPG